VEKLLISDEDGGERESSWEETLKSNAERAAKDNASTLNRTSNARLNTGQTPNAERRTSNIELYLV
jgi:hypothetical protein